MTLEQIAGVFGVHPITLSKWLRKADVEAEVRASANSDQLAELREARQRIRTLEPENEMLRRAAAYLSQANLPSSLGTGAGGIRDSPWSNITGMSGETNAQVAGLERKNNRAIAWIGLAGGLLIATAGLVAAHMTNDSQRAESRADYLRQQRQLAETKLLSDLWTLGSESQEFRRASLDKKHTTDDKFKSKLTEADVHAAQITLTQDAYAVQVIGSHGTPALAKQLYIVAGKMSSIFVGQADGTGQASDNADITKFNTQLLAVQDQFVAAARKDSTS